MKLIEKLNEIQQKLKVAKNQFNTFGKYKYRSTEDILEAVKPLLGKLVLIIEDEVINHGERYYVKAIISLKDENETITTSAYARESLIKKGMDEAQITGAASSYARKYALNGMFAIDDAKDADTMDNTQPTQQPAYTPAPKPAPQNAQTCPKCGAPMKISKAGKLYCSAVCWKNKPAPQQTTPERQTIENVKNTFNGVEVPNEEEINVENIPF